MEKCDRTHFLGLIAIATTLFSINASCIVNVIIVLASYLTHRRSRLVSLIYSVAKS